MRRIALTSSRSFLVLYFVNRYLFSSSASLASALSRRRSYDMIEFGYRGIRSADYLIPIVRLRSRYANPSRSSLFSKLSWISRPLASGPRPFVYNSTQLDAFTLSRLEYLRAHESSRLPVANTHLTPFPIHLLCHMNSTTLSSAYNVV